MTWEDACAIARQLPGVELSAYDGHPALRVAGQFLARLGDDGVTIEFKGLNADERDMLITARPHMFHALGPDRPLHARLPEIDEPTLRGMLEHRWRAVRRVG